jgi:hypothetical protein
VIRHAALKALAVDRSFLRDRGAVEEPENRTRARR